MKLLLLTCLLSLAFLGGINAAAIDTVVEKEKDTIQNEESESLLSNLDEECHQPREIGRCFALFYRYAFNTESLKCEEFIYGGCGGNKNNFETLEQCERKCLKKETGTETESPEHSDNDSEKDNTKGENQNENTTKMGSSAQSS